MLFGKVGCGGLHWPKPTFADCRYLIQQLWIICRNGGKMDMVESFGYRANQQCGGGQWRVLDSRGETAW